MNMGNESLDFLVMHLLVLCMSTVFLSLCFSFTEVRDQ